MKKNQLLSILIIGFYSLQLLPKDCCNQLCPSNIIHPKTFFNPRQVTFDSTFELALANYALYHSDKNCWAYFFATPFYQQSRNPKALGRYFLPNGKSSITIAQDGTGDVDPIWLQLMGQPGQLYSSTFSIRPERKAAGIVLNACFDLEKWRDRFENCWLSINTTILHVRHSLNTCEKPGHQLSCPENSNMCSALNNPKWCAGRFCSADKTGLDDIQLKFGYDWYKNYQDDRITTYLVAGIPTGKRPHSKFLFEPLVGSKHFCLGLGLNTDREIWQNADRTITWMMDLKYRYVFKARERRSFDMCKNLDWSRYLLLADETDPITPLPAINFLTLSAQVTPASTIDFWTALHYQRCDWNVEVGYNLWWRAHERIKFDCTPDLSSLGIFDIAGAAVLNPVSASNATISQSIGGANPVVSDATFVALTSSDINICSAEHPRSLSHKIYCAADYACEYRDYPLFLGFGFSYEFASPERNALEQWALFAKLEIDF